MRKIEDIHMKLFPGVPMTSGAEAFGKEILREQEHALKVATDSVLELTDLLVTHCDLNNQRVLDAVKRAEVIIAICREG